MECDQLAFDRDVCLTSAQRIVDCIQNEAEFRVRAKELGLIKKQFNATQIKLEKQLAKIGQFNKDEQLAIRDQFNTLYFKVQVALDKTNIERKQSVANTSAVCHSALPKIKLPPLSLATFNGDVTDFHAFYDLYLSLIHHNPHLTDVERFRYLLLSLKDEPYNLIKSIPITAANYENALQLLRDRYENHRIIATRHFDKIMDVPPMNEKNTQQSLRTILNVYTENLSALKSLELPVQEWSFMLLNILLRKITPEIRKRFETSLRSASEIPNVSELLNFLERELSASEVMAASAAGRAPVATRPAHAASAAARPATAGGSFRRAGAHVTRSPQPATTSRDVSSHAVTHHAENSKNIKCLFCKDDSHVLYKCENFTNMTIPEKRRFITQNKICFNCLFSGHEVNNCTSKFNCRVCHRRHHTSLHEDVGTTANVSHVTFNSQHSFQPSIACSVADTYSPERGTLEPLGNNTYLSGCAGSVAETNSPESGNNFISNEYVFPTCVDSVADINSPASGSLGESRSHLPRMASSVADNHSPELGVAIGTYPEQLSLAAELSPPSKLQRSDSGQEKCTILLTTALVNIRATGSDSNKPSPVRALIDQGSQATLISESCVQRLGLPRFHTQSRTTVIGIGGQCEQPRGCVMIEVTPHNRNEPRLLVEALILPRITSYIPTIPDSFDRISHLQNLPLADPELRTTARSVELLIGSDYTDRILLNDIIKGPIGTPVAINSIFGYLLNGKISHSLPTVVHSNINTCQLDLQLMKFWELESVPETKLLTQEETLCEQIFLQTHSRDETGKFTVALPFKEDVPPLGDSREIALSRLYKLETRLERDPALRKEYTQCLQEYLDMGHMEPAPTTSESSYYIPHHCVMKKGATTTKVRVVFDASCKTTSNRSLNDNLLIGQKLQQDISEILLRFRLNKIVFTADLKMMYRFINMRPQDRDFQRILWRDSPTQPVQEYRLCTVTFGVASSPFLALRVLRQLALDEAKAFPRASEVLLNSVFVDDCVSGAQTVDEALELQRELTALCKAGSFELRKWTSNSKEFLQSIQNDESTNDNAHILAALDSDASVKILGLKWSPDSDHFMYQVTPPNETCTKRIMLSEISKIYDPLGLLSPIILFTKHLIQRLWLAGTGWDDAPPPDICDAWRQFLSEIKLLQVISIPRHVLPANCNVQIHGFADASEKAYAAAVYLRVEDACGIVQIHLLLAKTKLAPLRRISLPRLELSGAVLLSKLIAKILITYGDILTINEVFAWSDSSVTLAWLRSPPHEWRTFVSNRITETTSRVPAAHWRHLRSEDNPADPASRGVLPSQLNQELWFHGPPWLSCNQSTWPVSNVDIQTDEERRKHILVCPADSPEFVTEFIERFSSLPKLLRVFCLILRLRPKSRKTTNMSHKFYTVHETQSALTKLILLVQQQEFADDISRIKDGKNCSNRLQRLRPFIDDAGLLRVGGRIQKSNLSYDAKHQIILPQRHALTKLLIDFYHLIHLHVGPQTLQFVLSQKYWILSARLAVRSRTRRCVRCFRARPTAPQPPMAPLPAARVRALRPFLHVAVDFAGHFYLKSGPYRNSKSMKAYVCVFVCMSTKAVHLELVPDLSTEAFLNALRRFISGRGRCTDIYSDCGRNFVGCNRYLKELFTFLKDESNQNELNNKLNLLAMTWHFNPPYASHFGGLFEAAVKSMKVHLQRVIGNLILNYDEFNTLLCQIEAVLNSRPITIQSNDPSDPLPLSPGHFLIGEPLTSLPEYDFETDKVSHLVRWQIVQQAVQHFWKRWSVEYLHQLSQRSQWFRDHTHTPLQEGAIVVLVDNSLPPLQWRLARVHKLHPGSDGITRVVTVRIGNSFSKRPVVKVCPLPIQ